jgi:Kdo2-lipid IVA lauroyltransferase/acyltransferase
MAREKASFLAELEYQLGVALPVAIVRSLSLPRAFRLGEALGGVAYRLARPQRRTALVNLRIAFPERSEREHLEIVLAACRNYGRMAAEFCHMRDITPANVADRVTFEDKAYWDANNHIIGTTGILVLTGHFGNWELLAHAMGMYGTPVHFIHRPFRNPAFGRFVDTERSRAGTGLISKRSAAREAVKVLHSHGIVAVPYDQNATGRWGVFADFMGVRASTHPGLARLAQMSGSPVYPVFLVRQDGSLRHQIVILPEVELVRDGEREATTLENLTRLNAVFAGMVRRHPDHWIWMHKRWRTRPPGEPPIY